MRSIRWRVAGFLAACGLLASVCSAREIYVATTGTDAAGRGGSSNPYRTIKYAIAQGTSGDTIHVRAGTYNENWILVKSGQTLVSEDGLYAAKIFSGNYSGLRFEGGVSNCVADGFECYGNWNTGSAGDGLLRIYNCSNITVRNMLIHDAPYDCDVVKIGGAGFTTTNVLLDNCVIYNPAHRTDGASYQECIDMYPANQVTLRHSWLYHTPEKGGDVLTFCKGGCTNITWENNVFGPAYSSPSGNVSCMAGGPSPAVLPAVSTFLARNNLFLQCSGDGAFGLYGVWGCQFYNNTIWGYKGGRAAIQFYTATIGSGPNQNKDFYFNNNIVWQTNGTPVFADRGIYTVDGTYIPTNFVHDYNSYYQASGGAVNVAAEPHSRFVDPKLTSPSGPVLGTDTWASIVADFRPLPISITINAGTSLGSLVPTDINSVTRPIDQFDIGPYEVLVGDVTADGHVDDADLLIFAGSWAKSVGDGGYNASCNFNADNRVDVSDLLKLAGNWGR